MQPSMEELTEMTRLAKEVVHLLEEYRRLAYPEFERPLTEPAGTSRCSEDRRPPKRPWEEMAQEDAAGDNAAFADVRFQKKKKQTYMSSVLTSVVF